MDCYFELGEAQAIISFPPRKVDEAMRGCEDQPIDAEFCLEAKAALAAIAAFFLQVEPEDQLAAASDIAGEQLPADKQQAVGVASKDH